MDHAAILQDISNQVRSNRLEGKPSRVRRHRPYCHRGAENEDYGTRTGLLIPRVERDADGFEPFDKLLELTDKLYPWYTDISRILPPQQPARPRDTLEDRRTTEESFLPAILTIEPAVPVVIEENPFPFMDLSDSLSDKTLVNLGIADQESLSPCEDGSGTFPKADHTVSDDHATALSINLNPELAL